MPKDIALTETVLEAFKRNRIKAASLLDGEGFLTFYENRLYFGTACRCEECPTVGTVNGGVIDATVTPHDALIGWAFVLSNRVIIDGVGCYDRDGSGDVLCSSCASNRDASKVKSL